MDRLANTCSAQCTEPQLAWPPAQAPFWCSTWTRARC